MIPCKVTFRIIIPYEESSIADLCRDEAIDKLLNLHSVVGSAKQLEGFGEDLTRVYYVRCSECGCDHNDNGNEYCCGCGREFE